MKKPSKPAGPVNMHKSNAMTGKPTPPVASKKAK